MLDPQDVIGSEDQVEGRAAFGKAFDILVTPETEDPAFNGMKKLIFSVI
jgi:hypothetical protein